ncbi:MAG: alpha/beta hydrolase [Actinomycetota bacterium]|nr:alpha/beta hydrolase [Actinomycetota bacterium]
MAAQVSVINGAEVFWESAGEGAAVVLIHAGVADLRMWDDLFGKLSLDFHCIRYDLRGFGRSSFPPGPFSHVDDLEALLDAAGVDSATLAGASFGGGVAVDFTLAHPHRVSRLVLVAAALRGHEWSEEVRRFGREEEAALDAGDVDAAVELNLKMWVDGPRREPTAVPARTRASIGEMQRNAFEKQIAAYEQTHPPTEVDDVQPPAATRLADIRVPTLVVVGEDDVSDFLEIADRASREIAHARKVVIPGTAHMLTLEKPDEFANHVLRFLKEPETEGGRTNL